MNEYKFSDLYVGMEASLEPICIKSENMDIFCSLTGDISPIHIDESYAIERGFPGRVCYGMLISAFYSTLIGVYLPGKYALFQEAHISMTKPVYIGDSLTVKGKIVELNEALKRVTTKARILNQKGEMVSRATLEAGVAE